MLTGIDTCNNKDYNLIELLNTKDIRRLNYCRSRQKKKFMGYQLPQICLFSIVIVNKLFVVSCPLLVINKKSHLAGLLYAECYVIY